MREFLNHVETTRSCGIATRNQRLAAIHALARFVVSGKAAAFFKGGSPVLHNVRVDIGDGGYQTWDRAARSEQVAGQSNCRCRRGSARVPRRRLRNRSEEHTSEL